LLRDPILYRKEIWMKLKKGIIAKGKTMNR
jgi:hypothetical protein